MDTKNNTGIDNTGDRNTGDRNTGDWNTGGWNTGYRNTGYMNTGSMNTGSMNTGGWNTGGWNTGYRNTGDWNTGNGNTGYMNTTTPKVRLFNKESDLEFGEIDFPDYFYFNLTEWVYEAEMTEKEKQENEQYKVTGGFLKVYEYKEAWRKSWDEATDEDKRKTLKLPNWNNEIFLEITGIDVEKELNQPKIDDATEEAMNLLKSKGFKIIKE